MRILQRWFLRLFNGLVYFAMLLPVLFVLAYSFNSSVFFSLPPSGVSLRWYQEAFTSGRFVEGLIVSTQVAFASTLLSLICGTTAAMALVRGNIPQKDVITQLLLSPLIIPAIPLGIGCLLLFTQASAALGFRVSGTFLSLVIGHTVISMPWVMRMVIAGMETLDVSLEEAAQSLGASPWQTMRHVTLPVLTPSIIAGGIFAFVTSFSDVNISLFLVGPSMTTLPITLLNYVSWKTDPSVAAISSVVIVMTFGIMMITDRVVSLNKVW